MSLFETGPGRPAWVGVTALCSLLILAACQTGPPPTTLIPTPSATAHAVATTPPTAAPATLAASAATLVQPVAQLPRPTVRLFFPEIDNAAYPATARPPSATPIPPTLAVTATPSRTATPGPTATRTASATMTPGPSPTPRPTRTPEPTATPKFPPPIAAPGASKLGLHVIRNNSPDIMEFIRVTKPRLVKGVDDLHWLTEVKQASPQTVTVGRIAVAEMKMEGDPAQAARALVAAQLAEYQFNRDGVDYWEGWNEPAPKSTAEMQWYAAMEAERVRALAEHGLRAAVGTFSTGVPEWDQFALFLPAIQAAKQHGGVLALHEYSAPTMQFGVGAGLPGRAPVAHRGALTLRYRWWYEDFLRPRGLEIPLVITEAGIDGGILNRPGPMDAFGWRDFGGYWSSQGLGGDTLATYMAQLAWYDQETRQDPYVLGFAVFTAGDIERQWVSFEITDVLPDIARYVVGQR